MLWELITHNWDVAFICIGTLLLIPYAIYDEFFRDEEES